MENVNAIELRHITKRFGSIVANNDINLEIAHGEIIALLGENGSGKTTLMNILSGIYHPDEGEIYVEGKEARILSPKDAYDYHIGMIHQHFKLIDVFTAAENVALGLDKSEKFDRSTIANRVREISDRYGFAIDPNKKVYDMSVSEKQTLEIIKILYRGADILILDEPTAVLTPQETRRLFQVLRAMKADGKAIIIITHKLNEVMDISDKVSVLRKGKYIGTKVTAETNTQELTEMMVGYSVSLNIDRPEPVDPQLRLKIEDLTVVDQENLMRLDHVSFDVYGGEILGIAGIAGSGQKELLEAIAGLQHIKGGSILYSAENSTEPAQLVGKTPMEIRKCGVGMAFVPEDRLGMGLAGTMGMTGNMMLRSWLHGKGIFVNRSKPKEQAEYIKNELEVVTPDINYPVRRLSGGNIQKVLVGREIATAPSVLMSAYAVRGLDINTSYTIYNLMTKQKMKGVAVLFVGEDLDVLLELCDRILVLCDGKVSGIVDARTATKEQIGLMMAHIPGEEAEKDD